MMLAIDIGNTTISFGILKGKRVLRMERVDTCGSVVNLKKRIKVVLSSLKKEFGVQERVVACSVVPKYSTLLKSMLRKEWRQSLFLAGVDIEIPIVNNYRDPKQVGMDRLVCAYAVKELYGVPAVIIDLGTAITFDVVSVKGMYEGGVIVPGLRLSAESLFKKTALLPQLHEIKAPKKLVGKNTEESILSGLFHGYGEMCSGLITQFAKEIRRAPQVVVTGGHASLMKKFISHQVTKVDPHLVFKGLALLK